MAKSKPDVRLSRRDGEEQIRRIGGARCEEGRLCDVGAVRCGRCGVKYEKGR